MFSISYEHRSTQSGPNLSQKFCLFASVPAATRNGFTNSLGNGPEMFAYTRTTSSVAPYEKNIIDPYPGHYPEASSNYRK